MRNNKADIRRKMVSGVAKVTLLVMIFAIIFAGTLSGAFGIESLAIEQAQLDGIEGNLTDTVGVADAAKKKTADPIEKPGTYTNISDGDSKGNGYLWHGWGDSDAGTVNFFFSTIMQRLINSRCVTATFEGYYGQEGGNDRVRFGIWGGKGKESGGLGEPNTSFTGIDKYYQIPAGKALTAPSNWLDAYTGTLSRGAEIPFNSGEITLTNTQLNITSWSTDQGALSSIDSGFYNVTLTIGLKNIDNAFTGSGTQSSPFILATREDFDVLSMFCQFNLDCTKSKYFKVQPASGKTVDFGTADFTPIGGVKPDGGADNSTYIFKGYLDGNSCTLTNVKVGKESSYNGLFGVTSGTTISNLTIKDPTINGAGTSRGAFIGRANGTTTLTNCTVSGGSVSGTYQIGGLVGYSAGAITFSGCKNDGTSVSATSATTSSQTRAGGFLGSCDSSVTISGTSSNSGAVWSSAGDDKMGVGGFVGYVNTNLNISGNLTNSGNIGADDSKYGLYTGGIAGWVKGNVSIDADSKLTNSGKIIARAIAGGCFGYTGGGNIIRCQNTGDVIAKGQNYKFGNLSEGGATLGGIVGYANGGDISHCYSSGQISTLKDPSNLDSGEFEGGGTNFIGGIAGYVNGNVSYCYAKNDIQGSHYIGGIVGLNYNNSHTISYCYFDGSILGLWNSGNAYVGLICGNGVAEISLDNTNLLLPNAQGIKEHGAGSVVYKQQAPQVTKTSDITLYAADNVTKWDYWPSWTSIITKDIVGIRISATVEDGKYLRFNSPTQILSGDQVESNTSNGETATSFSPKVYFSADRTTGINVQKGDIAINGTKDTTYGVACNLTAGWDDIDATGKALYTSTSPKWYFSGTSYNGVQKFDYKTSTVGNAPSNPPTQAGKYDMVLEVCINGVVLGQVQAKYNIAQKKLGLSAIDHANKALQPGTLAIYTYNGSDQGLKTLTVSDIVDSGKTAQNIMDVKASWLSGYVSPVDDIYTFSGSKNASAIEYKVALTISDKNYTFGDSDEIYTLNYIWKIAQKELEISAVSHSGADFDLNGSYSFTYNGTDQGLKTLSIGNIVDSDKTAKDIMDVSASWFSSVPFANNEYTFSGSVNADETAYYVELTLTDTNYILPGNLRSAKYTWTIGKQPIELKGEYSRDDINYPNEFPQNSLQESTYNTKRQGLVQISINGLLTDYDKTSDVVAFTWVGDFTDEYGKKALNPYFQDPDTGTTIVMTAVNAGEYSITITLTNDNYQLKNSSNTVVDNIKYEWKINPKTISVDGFAYAATLEDGNGHKYGDGSVANNAFIGRGYLLSRLGNDGKIPNKLALVYQSGAYAFNNFEVTATFLDNNNNLYWKYLTLAGSGTAESFGSKNFKATFTAKKGAIESSGNVEDIDSISFSGTDHTPTTYTLTFESLDSNYVFDTKNNNNTIVYTLLVSDFGGGYNAQNWGSVDNPFVISTKEHLLRLSQIVNGAVAWNSIRTADTSVCATNNEKVASNITARTYANAFFKVELPDGQDTLTVTQDMGFVPIGGHDVDGTRVEDKYFFAGNFAGEVEKQTNNGKEEIVNKYTIRVAQQYDVTSDSFKNNQNACDYVGLFGILKNAVVRDINIVVYGGVNGSGVPNAPMIGRNYVGAVAGYAENVTINNVTTGTSTAIDEGSWIEATGDYVGGIVGMYKAKIVTDFNEEIGIIDAYARLYGYIGRNNVGGIAGLSVGGRIVNPNVSENDASQNVLNGENYVGGIAGKIESTAIMELGWDNNTKDITGAFFKGWLHGVKYVGTIAGHWMVTDGRQVNGERNLLSQGNQNMYVKGDTFVGGLAGYFDASNCSGGLTITPKLIGGDHVTAHNSMTVTGANYVGALFGVFIGSGYKKTSAEYNENTDTLLLVAGNSNGKYNISATVNIQGETLASASGNVKANVIGGLVGYIANTGIAFTTAYGYMKTNGTTNNFNPVELKVLDNSTGYKEVAEINFVGMIAGIMGENSTIECTEPDGSNGDYSQILLVTNGSSLGGKKNDFVGRIAGYVASNAGIKNGDTGTMFGNRMVIVSAGSTNGHNYVGGMFGAIGKVEISGNKIKDSINIPYSNASNSTTKEEYRLLHNALRGRSFVTNTESTTTLVFGPRAQAIGESGQPYGRIANRGNVEGTDYIGGIVGAVLDNARLDFVNPQWDGYKADGTQASYTDLTTIYDSSTYKFNGYHTYIISGGKESISEVKGTNYVGGIAGYLGSGAHMLERVVSRINLSGNENVGGIAGYMKSGTIQNCLTPYTGLVTGITISSYDIYKGTKNVGGIVGYMESGKILDSISTGMKFDGFADSKNTVGGVVGYATQNAKVENSWAIFVSAGPDGNSGPTYASTPANEWGKYIVISNTIRFVPNYVELARMIGLYNFNTSAVSKEVQNATFYEKSEVNGTTVETDYSAEYGELSLGATVPTNNSQLVFYNASGRDVVTDNKFEVFKTYTGKLYMRFKAFGEGAQNSMIITTTPVRFANIAPYKGTDETGKNSNAQKGYVKPSGSNKYVAEVTGATYHGEDYSYNIESLTANIYFDDALVGTADEYKQKQVGYYDSGKLTPGSSADSPYIIASQQDWDDFAWNIYTGQKDYAGEYVKLTTDEVKIFSGTHGSYNFDAVTSPNDYAKDDKHAQSNGGYNVAGNLSQGKENKASVVTVVGATKGTKTASFKGNFDGGGHTITITATEDNQWHRMSVFPNAESATFQNLTIAGEIQASGAFDISAFVGKPFGYIGFYNCTNKANITALRNVAGFASYSSSNVQIDLICCVNDGNITSTAELTGEDWNTATGQNIGTQKNYQHGTGGFIANVSASITVESCINRGNITTNAVKAGGIIGRVTSTGDKTELNMLNCANTGNITSKGLNPNKKNGNKKEKAGNVMAETGGIVGEADDKVQATFYACYNTGDIRAYGSVIGGIVGILGRIPDTEKSYSAEAKYESTINNCYNTGSITGGYEENGGIIMFGTSGYNFNGCDIGGIVGCAVILKVNNCYNAGTITTYGGIGYFGSWQTRNGGILGEAADAVDYCAITITNCYNVGRIYIKESTDSSTRYSADIIGYMENASTAILTYNCFGIKQNIVNYDDGSPRYWNGWNGQGGGSQEYTRSGKTLDSLADLTVLLDDNGKLRPKNDLVYNTLTEPGVKATSRFTEGQIRWEDGFLSINRGWYYDTKEENGLSYESGAWLYIPGCLPQLKVFAVDTPNGLSMDSVKAHSIEDKRDENKVLTRVTVKQATAGDLEEYPYIIRDGVGLLGLQRLVALGNTFENKNIAFANDINSIFGASRAIDMTTFKYAKTEDGSASYNGKSYHLFEKGAVNNTAAGTAEATTYNAWLENHHYYDNNGSLQKAKDIDTPVSWTDITENYNFAPIGSKTNVFAGNITGYNDDGNVVLKNLRLNVPNGTNYGGLFGYIDGANISYITTAGNINVNGYAGGIVGQLVDSTVDHCNAGTSSDVLNIVNYNTTASYNPTGGIVGFSDGNKWFITNCVASNVTLKSDKQYIGGIVGKTNGTIGKITGCEVQKVAMSTTNATNARFLGGIVGYNNADQLEIANAKVGVNGATTIPGAYALGGIIGVAGEGKSTYIHDCEVGHTLQIVRNSSTPSSQYGVAIGGIVGYSADVENGRVLTFGGEIIFNGEIIIGTATDSNTISNIGGIIGYMGSGSVFEDGSNVSVDGKITFNSNATGTRKNIGGVAGITKDVEFIGTFNVNPKMNLGSDTTIQNVGGFIGFNDGVCAIIADGEIVTLVAEGQVSAEGGTHIKIGGEIGSAKADNVGGFIGNNNHTLNIGPDEANGVRYDGEILNIEISGQITGHDYVGGFVGNNPNKKGTVAGIDIKKGNIEISGGTITGNDCVGGIVGNNMDKLTTGGSVIPGATLSITNKGAVIGHNKVGGVFGYLENANIADTFTNSGSVSSSGDAVKTGIMDNGSEISAGASFVGGVIGFMKNSTIYGGKFTNSGTVSATLKADDNNIGNYIGGVIGYMDESSITGGEFINEGAVSGNQYVGGSIGFVVKTSTITNEDSKKDIKFVNGAVQTTPPSNPEAQTAVEGAQTSAENGKISGNIFVGGSIGIMRGEIIGSPDNKVQFDNLGTVGGYENSLVYYVGGSVAIITGSVDYAVFSNRSTGMAVEGANIVGGSIGIIIGAEGAPAEINNTHFEFTGQLVVTNSQGGWNEDTQKSNFVGIGGSIGVINQATWGETNTFYSSGQVQATGKDAENGAENVGGSIGLIAQAGIKISNMLAYETKVIGRQNVGGIVGATTATNTKIENSFNVRGTVEGINAGGIIGNAMTDTDASTSYWVKAEDNINLEKTDINNLNASLGKNENVKIDGENLSDTVPSPIEYIDNRINATENPLTGTSTPKLEEVDIDNGEINVTTTYELKVVFKIGETSSATIQIVRTDKVKYERILDDDGNRVDTIIEHLKAYTYKIGETTGDIVEDVVDADGNITSKGTNNWNALLEKTELKGKYTYTNGYYVYSTSTTTYSTGNATTGWYFVYSNTQKEGYINAIHSEFSRTITYDKITVNADGSTTTEEKSYTFGGDKASVAERDRQAWKYIANAYTVEEKAFIARAKLDADGKRMDKVVTNLVNEGSDFNADHVFATATVGRDVIDNGVTSSYYLYVATSGKDEVTKNPVKPTLTQGKVDTNKEGTAKEDGYFVDFVTYLTGETRKSVENIAIYYRKLQYKSSIVYNGYDRIAPITDNSDTFTKAGYDFSSFLQKGSTEKFIAVGKYSSTGTVEYTNADGAKLPMSGTVSFEWKITEKEITITTNTSKGGSYGNQSEIIVTAEGISPNAVSNGVDDIHLVIGVYSKKGNNETFVANVVVSKEGDKYVAKTYDDKLSQETTTNKVKDIKVNVKEGKKFGATGSSYTAESGISSSTTWADWEVSMKFTDAKTYVLEYENTYDTPAGVTKELKNYRLTSKEANVKVEPKKLEIEVDSKYTSRIYDGKTNTKDVEWFISDWEKGEGFGGSAIPNYADLFDAGIVISNKKGNSDLGFNLTAKSTINTTSSYTGGSGKFIDAGSYAVKFANTNATVNGTKFIIGNYYFEIGEAKGVEKIKVGSNDCYVSKSKFTIGQIEVVISEIQSGGSHTYGDKDYGTATYEFKVREAGKTSYQPVGSYLELIANSFVFDSSKVDTSLKHFEGLGSGKVAIDKNKLVKKDEYTAKLTINTGRNAGKYKAVLDKSGDTDNRVSDLNDKSTVEYTINQKTLTFEYSHTENKTTYTYNTKHQGISSVSIKETLPYDDSLTLTLKVTSDTGKWAGTTITGYKSGQPKVETSDVGKYTLQVTALTIGNKTASNYKIDNISSSDSWEITKKSIELTVTTASSETYNGKPHEPTVSIVGATGNKYYDDELSFVYKFNNGTANVSQMIDVGMYTIAYNTNDLTVKRSTGDTGSNGVKLIDNYKVTEGSGSLNFEITKATLTLEWSDDKLYYNGNDQGQTVSGGSTTPSTSKVSASENGLSVEWTGGCADELTISLTGQQTNAGEYTMTATVGGDRAKNYTIDGTRTENYTINKAEVKIGTVTGYDTTKVYDATTKYDRTFSVSWNKVHGDYVMKSSDYSISGAYDAKDVGNRKINYTVTISNSNVECNVKTGSIDGSITPAELTVELDKLRNGKATKAYDGTKYYGGEDGFENGDSRSQIYRSGEGFIVTGFPDDETAKTVKFVATYVETGNDRSAFDAFVNNVVGSGENVSILPSNTAKENKFYKKLVFTMGKGSAGDNSDNYTFKVKIGSTEITANGKEATIFDKDDDKNRDEQNSGISIEITVKALKATYKNTAQSYANADNTYNTDWLDVTGTDATKAGLTINVVNGWMYENGKDGTKKQYDKYTVIRGRAGSDVLSASIKAESDGSHINYRLSNQPILTIGYFVDTDDFPIGSMASLMIATYYQQASNPEFSKPIIAETTWKLVATVEQYEKGEGMTEGYATWDAYFEYLETEAGGKHYVFLNTAETDAGWGYYEVSAEQGTANKYDSFKQVANVSGILTEQDINILDNFFALYTYGEDGSISNVERKEWGVGKTYIDNFLNVGAGNVAVALGSIFTGEFTGKYDGNGYTINHVNIMGLAGDTNVGMFANIATKEGKTGSVKNVHLRNFSIIANCASENTYNVGGIAGISVSALENCTFHGSITVNGNGATVNVGGIAGSASANITGAIVLGNIDVTNRGTSNVGGVVGSASSSIALNDIVSMIEILANGNVDAIVGNGSANAGANVYYLANSAYTKALDSATGSVGTEKPYNELMEYSASGYLETAETYDVIANVEIIEGQDGTKPAARESMHLQDIVKVYLLMYSQSDSGNGYLTVSESSWLVGNADGTTTNPIVIANQQDVALLRQFRFATFTLANDVEMYSTRPNTVFDGVFYGTVQANEHTIYVYKQSESESDSPNMFEKVVGTELPIKFK